MNTHELNVAVIIDAKPQKIWEILTDPVWIEKWLMGVKTSVLWEKGNDIVYELEYEGTLYHDKGKVVEVIENEKLVHTLWSNSFGTPDIPENYRTLTYELKYLGNGQTRLSFNATPFESAEIAAGKEPSVLKTLEKIKEIAEQN